MSIKERCLLIEWAIYAKDEYEDLPEEYQDMWQLLEAKSEPERVALLARKEGRSSQGGGSWPPTAASLP
ncbi:hypothetical protein D8674_005938 [Pyrus ussuriensis x Pyrus communis]|uniref:Uncharacterized protein n=1 Tax=Pyrus ussuriensis x Pyrus communis TaxID=2448454 RepID=A0A5N5FX93_9ROSA|nr:hypothetical protein D8674_005938 [Pyrus ussuriensis x Pyrus communis]